MHKWSWNWQHRIHQRPILLYFPFYHRKCQLRKFVVVEPSSSIEFVLLQFAREVLYRLSHYELNYLIILFCILKLTIYWPEFITRIEVSALCHLNNSFFKTSAKNYQNQKSKMNLNLNCIDIKKIRVIIPNFNISKLKIYPFRKLKLDWT